MLTKIIIDNFKGLPQCEIELGQTVVLVGPNNSGKTTALQALSLWETGLHFWMSKRSVDSSAKKRVGITINRRDLITIPISDTKYLWQNQSVRVGSTNTETKQRTENVLIQITVEGIFNNESWSCGLEFDYSNSEVIYCRPIRNQEERFRQLLETYKDEFESLRIAMLPPMSGLASVERKLESGSIDVLIGEGQTAQVLRNLCFSLYTDNKDDHWKKLCAQMQSLFGIVLSEPLYDKSRGEISMYYSSSGDTHKKALEISSAGRGLQQVLLILTFLYLHPHAIILLDEPDAHLEILRQKQIYDVIKIVAEIQHGQIVAATHSEVILNESAEKDTVIAFLGKPHKLNDKPQLKKSLADIGWDQYFLAEQKGWILYLAASTDLDMLRAFAKLLHHPAAQDLVTVFSHYIGDNTISKAEQHFFGLREAKRDLKGYVLLDRIAETKIKSIDGLTEYTLKRREIENYFCTKNTLIAWARGRNPDNGLFKQADTAEQIMRESIEKIEESIKTLKPKIRSIWSPELKASDDILIPILTYYFEKMEQHSQVQKSRFHELIPFMPTEEVDNEIIEVLDTIHNIASSVNS
ncbi:ATPase AAA [Planctomycetales bacterium]|nr:ATPase AAA [Planctomycetales bacterium]